MPPAPGLQDRKGFELYINLSYVVIFGGLISPFFVSWVVSFLIVGCGIAIYSIAEVGSRPPTNNPASFHRFFTNSSDRRSPVLVCVGDSLIHGKLSADITTEIVPKLCERLKFDPPPTPRQTFEEPLWIVNSGQNGIVTHAVLNQRLPYVMACYPDFVCIMLGSKDVCTMYKGFGSGNVVKMWNLPEAPNMDNFKANIRGIVNFIRQSSPKTHIGVCTIPPMGEDLTFKANRLVKEVNNAIHSVVNEFSTTADQDGSDHVFLIPIFERMENELRSNARQWNTLRVDFGMLATTAFIPLHHFFGISYNNLSKLFSHTYLVDSMHLTEDAAAMVAEEIVQWLLKCNVHKAIAVKRF